MRATLVYYSPARIAEEGLFVFFDYLAAFTTICDVRRHDVNVVVILDCVQLILVP